MVEKVTIVGSSSWATALVKLFSESSFAVSCLLRDEEHIAFVKTNKQQSGYLGTTLLNKRHMHTLAKPEGALFGADLIIFAMAPAQLKDTLRQIDPELLNDKRLAVCIHGLIPGSGLTPSRFIQNYLESDASPVMIIGGPCHPDEIIHQKTAYLTISTEDIVWGETLCSKLRNDHLHVISNNDPLGIEYTSILKSVMGIATGIANGLGYGDNFQAVLVSNAMRESAHFLQEIFPRRRDLYLSAYLGNLLVTAFTERSRNRGFGKLIGEGASVDQALLTSEIVPEGFYASKELAPLLKQLTIRMPVVNAVHRVLHRQANARQEFKLLEQHLC
jgi:glycerol-3-phosphate dehydrogenase (NAD(P)+)